MGLLRLRRRAKGARKSAQPLDGCRSLFTPPCEASILCDLSAASQRGRRPAVLRRLVVPMLDAIRLPFKQGVAAWCLASAVGYWLYIRPKWYPTIEHEKAVPFTPKEVEQWTVGQQKMSKK